MTNASKGDAPKRSHTDLGRRMCELKDEVFAAWVLQVRCLPEAECITQPILINTLPAFYDNIVQAVSENSPRLTATDGLSLAAEHGGERARLTAYSHQALITEYQMFRWAIFDVLTKRGVPLAPAHNAAINASIDAGIKEAVNGFTLVHNDLRERFAAALTHDMRTPLAIAVTALEVGLLTSSQEKSHAMTRKALVSLKRMDSMINELLHSMAFASGHTMTITHSFFDALELAKEVQFDVSEIFGPRLNVKGEPVVGWWGRPELKRALENVVSNAFKYGSESAQVEVEVSEGYGRLQISVHNDGPPIPVEDQECIFQLYRRADHGLESHSGGWGIGLPYVRAVAESHGGGVGVDSSEERGTVFLIDVPIDARPVAKPK